MEFFSYFFFLKKKRKRERDIKSILLTYDEENKEPNKQLANLSHQSNQIPLGCGVLSVKSTCIKATGLLFVNVPSLQITAAPLHCVCMNGGDMCLPTGPRERGGVRKERYF